MSAILERPVLVLNKGFSPLKTVSMKEAIGLAYSTYKNGQPKAVIVDPGTFEEFTWERWSELRPLATDEVIRGANMVFRVPSVVRLTKYDKMPVERNNFTRRRLFERDAFTCQYCGAKPGAKELTIDHVIPRSRGGKTTWDNTVLACVSCNARKANRTPQQAGMKLIATPKKPRPNLFKGHCTPLDSWKSLLDESYWNVPLKD